METFGTLGERGLIERIRATARPPPPPGRLDDDAVDVAGVIACVDSVTFERHMPPGMSYGEFGWMAAAASLSDLAAMGARPTGILAAMLLPPGMPVGDVLDIVGGMDRCAESCGTHLYGGDTKPGAGSVSVTALGDMENREPMARSGAREGDAVAVTGPLGGPAAGFECLRNGWDPVGGLKDAVASLYSPVPRIDWGVLLSGSGAVTSCIDLSDGLATAANAVCDASGVGMLFEASFLPEGPGVAVASGRLGVPAAELMTSFGGEYELMFTFPRERLENIHSSGVPFHVVGYVDGGDGARLSLDGEERRLEHGRY
ncbi:MAG: thiamine-phosphate kinase [Thermoplasmatales archaeon]|nr:thiamine-phosphate kinase [Thermoplasmatales archaeon]